MIRCSTPCPVASRACPAGVWECNSTGAPAKKMIANTVPSRAEICSLFLIEPPDCSLASDCSLFGGSTPLESGADPITFDVSRASELHNSGYSPGPLIQLLRQP